MVRFLIEQGADPKVRNQRGEEEGMSSLERVEWSKNEKIRHAVLGEANSKVNERSKNEKIRHAVLGEANSEENERAQKKEPRYDFRKRK